MWPSGYAGDPLGTEATRKWRVGSIPAIEPTRCAFGERKLAEGFIIRNREALRIRLGPLYSDLKLATV